MLQCSENPEQSRTCYRWVDHVSFIKIYTETTWGNFAPPEGKNKIANYLLGTVDALLVERWGQKISSSPSKRKKTNSIKVNSTPWCSAKLNCDDREKDKDPFSCFINAMWCKLKSFKRYNEKMKNSTRDDERWWISTNINFASALSNWTKHFNGSQLLISPNVPT